MKKIKEGLKRLLQFIFILSVIIATFIFAMFQGGLVSWTIFYTILPFVLYSFLIFFYPLSSFKVTREIRTRYAESGGKLSVVLTMKRNFRFPLLYVVISECWDEEKLVASTMGNTSRLFIFGFRKELVWTYELVDLPRGEHLLKGLDIEVSDFFGWIRKSKFISIEDKFLVYPKMIDLKNAQFNRQSEHGIASSPFNILKDTTMVTGVRNYEAGDRVSWIHWKSFARTGELMTKEFEDRRSQDLLLMLDIRNSSMFEEQIVLAASILKVSKDYQTGIGFMSIPVQAGELELKRNVFPFLKSEAQFRSAFSHLATVKPINMLVVERFWNDTNTFNKSGTFIVITGNPDEAFLQQLISGAIGASSIVCFVIVKEELAEGTEVMKNVTFAKQKGINVQVIMPAQFSDALKEVVYS